MPNPFVHVELSTTDPAQAKSSYGALFDRKLEDMPTGPDTSTIHTMADVWDAYRSELEGVEERIHKNLTSSVALVNTVAAHDRYKGPLIIVDFGTATTLDVVDRDGNYCGGVIAPGINLSLTALHMAAAKLPSVRISRTERVIGKDTESCMQSGIYWGYVGLVEGLVGRIKSEFGAPMRTIATGGLAPLFAGATDAIEHVDPDLTLWGLRLIFERNTKR